MLYTKCIQKEPYLIITPFDDWRDEKRFVTSDAANRTLITCICDVYLVDASLSWPTSFLAVSLFSEIVKTFERASVLMVGNLNLAPAGTLSAFSVTDSDEDNIACTDALFIDPATPSYQSCWEQTFLSSLIIDTDFRLYHIYVWVLLTAKLYYLRRVNGRKTHVSLELHACNLGNMIQALAILATTEGKKKSFVRRVCQRKLFSLSQQLYRVLYLLLESFREFRKNFF